MSFWSFIRGYFLFNFFCDLFSDSSERRTGQSPVYDDRRYWDDCDSSHDYGYDNDYDIDDDIADDFDDF